MLKHLTEQHSIISPGGSMFSIIEWDQLSQGEQAQYLSRSERDIHQAETNVQPIIEAVRLRGDDALREFALNLDKADISSLPIAVQPEEFEQAKHLLTPDVRTALEYCVENVRRFHNAQRPGELNMIEIRPGIFAGERPSPIDSVGLYVPRGRGSFPSMLYMLGVPATIAGVPDIAIATPPLEDGRVDPACLYAAELCGIPRVYRMGGAQAMAAFALGTESVQPVIKVIGPGSMYVSAAKRLLADRIDPGLPAGPSESIVLADESADAYLVTLDLFIEAEHGSDSSAILITDSKRLAHQVSAMAAEYLQTVPEPRRSFIADVFSGYGGIILTKTMDDAIELANGFATEHLQIQSADPKQYVSKIRNAGEILLGSGVPFSLANYAVGANAVLPTGGKARSWSSVSVRDFMKYNSVVEIAPQSYEEIATHTKALADYEGFYTHAQALRGRDLRETWAVSGADSDAPKDEAT